jgi:DNA-binding MarR family transcriptional regulator
MAYVKRVPDPADRRARLVPGDREGQGDHAIAREVIAEIEAEWTARLGRGKMRELRTILEELNAGLGDL